MKFVVDKCPDKGECPFASWKPYPPIVEKTGDWYCKNDNKICNVCETGCRWMKPCEQSSD